MSRAETTSGPWGLHSVEEGTTTTVPIGPLLLRVRAEAGEIRITHEHAPEDGERPADRGGAEPASAAPPTPRPEEEESAWSRWAPRDWTGEVDVRPTLPDRPVVVSPQDRFHLLPGAEARIYVRVPLWARVEAVRTDGARDELELLPTIPASDTWWGTVQDGELCYWLTTLARRTLSEALFEPHLAICPLSLANHSDDDLPVDKIALRVEHLSLYHDGHRIFSDETEVDYHGDDDGSRLRTSGRAPPEASDVTLLAPARVPMQRGFRARTFRTLRSMKEWIS